MPKYVTAPYLNYSINSVLKLAVEQINQLKNEGQKVASVVFVDPDVYCNDLECQLFLSSGESIYSDTNHYTWAGSIKAATNLLSHMGLDVGVERSDFESSPSIDFKEIQTVLEYSEESGFKFLIRNRELYVR